MYRLHLVSSVLLLSLSAVTLRAAEAADTTLLLNEVSVTAIKQSRSVADLPEAATVIGESEVERFNIVTMKGVSEIAPNFYIPDYGSRMTSSIYVRGIGARIDQPVIGLNVDNVPYLNKDNYDFDLVDIERIEMLRGPQSTLYGRNTMGGLVNIYTLSPMRFQGVRGTVEYGSANSLKVAASYYHKPAPSLGMSYTGYFTRTDGFFTNAFNGKKCDGEKQGSLRWKTVWNAGNGVTMENVASVQLSRQGGYPYESVATGLIACNDTCFYRRTGVNDGLTVKWCLGNVVLSGITSFQYINDNMTLDQDFLPEPYFTLTQARREWAFTQDFVARGAAGNYSWLGGLFGFVKRTHMDAPVTFKQTGIDRLILEHVNRFSGDYPTVWDEDSFVLSSSFINPVWGVALYHNSALSLGQWDFSLGLRLDIERTSLRYNSRCNTSFTIMNLDDGQVHVDIDDRGKLARTFVELLPKFSVTYNIVSLPASNVYLSVARGYKAGGFNTQMFSDVLQQRLMGYMGLAERYDVDRIISYKPESSWNYEAGAHISDPSGSLSAQAALFYIDCRDQQVTMFPDGTTTGRIMANAGRSRSYGVELTVRYSPIERLAVTASYGFTDARFTEFNDGINDYSGKYIPYAPHNTFFAGVDYRLPLPESVPALTLDVNCRGVGEIMWDEDNTVRQPFYMLPGASLKMDFKHCSLTLWGENLSDTKYDTFYFVSIGNAFLQRGKPIRGGVTLRVQI